MSVTLLVGPLSGSLDAHAQTYLAGNTVSSSREERRQGAGGRSWAFATPDGKKRHALLLLEEGGKVYGLYAQGEAAFFAEQEPTLEEMARSLTLERPEAYRRHRNDKQGFSIALPDSWKEAHTFSSGATFMQQFTSPALGADRRQTVHASLTLTAEPAPGGGSLEAAYRLTRERLGEAFRVLSHEPWEGGYVDLMRTSTPVAESSVKRFFRVSGGRAYTLSCDAREDVFHRASRWCDLIAGTLRTGTELDRP